MRMLRYAEGVRRLDYEALDELELFRHDSVKDITPQIPCTLDNSPIDTPIGPSIGWGIFACRYLLLPTMGG